MITRKHCFKKKQIFFLFSILLILEIAKCQIPKADFEPLGADILVKEIEKDLEDLKNDRNIVKNDEASRIYQEKRGRGILYSNLRGPLDDYEDSPGIEDDALLQDAMKDIDNIQQKRKLYSKFKNGNMPKVPFSLHPDLANFYLNWNNEQRRKFVLNDTRNKNENSDDVLKSVPNAETETQLKENLAEKPSPIYRPSVQAEPDLKSKRKKLKKGDYIKTYRKPEKMSYKNYRIVPHDEEPIVEDFSIRKLLSDLRGQISSVEVPDQNGAPHRPNNNDLIGIKHDFSLPKESSRQENARVSHATSPEELAEIFSERKEKKYRHNDLDNARGIKDEYNPGQLNEKPRAKNFVMKNSDDDLNKPGDKPQKDLPIAKDLSLFIRSESAVGKAIKSDDEFGKHKESTQNSTLFEAEDVVAKMMEEKAYQNESMADIKDSGVDRIDLNVSRSESFWHNVIHGRRGAIAAGCVVISIGLILVSMSLGYSIANRRNRDKQTDKNNNKRYLELGSPSERTSLRKSHRSLFPLSSDEDDDSQSSDNEIDVE